MTFPSKCEYGGSVVPLSKPGRTMGYKDLHDIVLPEDFEIPTCEQCSEEFYDDELINRVDVILDNIYEQRKR